MAKEANVGKTVFGFSLYNPFEPMGFLHLHYSMGVGLYFNAIVIETSAGGFYYIRIKIETSLCLDAFHHTMR